AQHCTARNPSCGDCPLRRTCRWAATGRPDPDPAARRRSQPAFAGSDRQRRGRLVAALRRAPVAACGLAVAAGWPAESERAVRIAEALVAEGLAGWEAGALTLV
ncbi:MAG: A/G-specific adenine glycosylase, partial [Acidimicrobiales bacterium]